MSIGKIAVLILTIAFVSFGVGAAFADRSETRHGSAIQLQDVDARKNEAADDPATLISDDDDDRGDGDRTRGNDGTRGGDNTGDGDRTRGNDGTRGGDNTGDGDWTGGNDGTGGGDNTRAPAPAPTGGGDTRGGGTGGGTGGGDT